MRVNLFDIGKDGKAKITSHVKEIWYLNAIVDRYGEEDALKIFKIFDFMYNLNPAENPFTTLPDLNKYETILRATYPELIAKINKNNSDDLIETTMDLVEELYETEKYRAFKALKSTYDRLIEKIRYTEIILTKEEGNIGEINKALAAFEDLNKKLSSTYKEVEEEMNLVKTRGDMKQRRKVQVELD